MCTALGTTLTNPPAVEIVSLVAHSILVQRSSCTVGTQTVVHVRFHLPHFERGEVALTRHAATNKFQRDWRLQVSGERPLQPNQEGQ